MSALLKSRRLRKRAIFRWSLLVVPLAFLLAQIKPVDGISTPVLVGIIIIAALLPLIIIHLLLSRRQNRRRRGREAPAIVLPATPATPATPGATSKRQHPPADVLNRNRHADVESEAESCEDDKIERSAVSADHADNDQKLSGVAEIDPDDREMDMDATICTPEQLQEQVAKVGDVVQTHDLGSDNMEYDYSMNMIQEDRDRQDQLTEAGSSLITASTHADTANLSELTRTEISHLVKTLQKDKVRLHRLVIAQQSAIDSERKAHDRSRAVARDAIKIMRDSREGQKQAEKLARRERSERKRIEQEYKKVSHALDNAMSIIEARKNEPA